MMRLSRYSGNPNIAVFATAGEGLALTAADADPGFIRTLESALGVDVIKVSVGGSFVVGSLVAMNSNGAIVSGLADDGEMPAISEKTAEMIGDILGVEAVRSSIGGINTVGSICRVTNKGCACHMDASDEEIQLIKDVLKVEAVRTTVNHGVRAVGAGIIANSKGAVVGDESTPIELGKIEDALALF